MSKFITIEGFEKLSKQELFDMAAKHVLKNGEPSLDSNGAVCLYGGIGCAAAPFIKQGEHNTADKGNEHGETSWKSLFMADLVPEHFADFVMHLQGCHDSWTCADKDSTTFVQHFKTRMGILGQAEGLDISVLNG